MRKPRSGVYGEMRRRTEPSKLLSNEPQASCSNSHSGKFPRRLLFLAIPASLLISLPLSSHCSFYNERASNETYTYTHIYACTVLLYLCDTAIYLLCMRALSFGVFSIFFAIAFLLHLLRFFARFSWWSVLVYRDFFPSFVASRVRLRVRGAG